MRFLAKKAATGSLSSITHTDLSIPAGCCWISFLVESVFEITRVPRPGFAEIRSLVKRVRAATNPTVLTNLLTSKFILRRCIVNIGRVETAICISIGQPQVKIDKMCLES